MKKIIISIICIFTLCSCSIDKYTYSDLDINNKKSDNYIDNNPIKVGFYNNSNLVKDYTIKLKNMTDFANFFVVYSNQDHIESGWIKNVYNKYYNSYKDISKYKTGFKISFKNKEGEYFEGLILKPDEIFKFSPYIYVYLYDGVNRNYGEFYSHIDISEYNEKTVISGIKLFFATEAIKIDGAIKFSVFTYTDDDIKDNKYRGKSIYTINIYTN